MTDADLENKVDTLIATLENEQDKEKSEDEVKKARKAALKSTLDHMDDEGKEKLLKSIEEDDDESEEVKEAAQEIREDEEKKAKKSRKANESEEDKAKDEIIKKMESRMRAQAEQIIGLQAGTKSQMIDEMLFAKEMAGESDIKLQVYGAQLKAKSFEEIESLHKDNETYILAAKRAKENPIKQGEHFAFMGSVNTAQMTKVSDILNGGGVN